jgi:hypothetical protein
LQHEWTKSLESTGHETLDTGFLWCGCDIYLCLDGAAGYSADEDIDSGKQGSDQEILLTSRKIYAEVAAKVPFGYNDDTIAITVRLEYRNKS